MGLSIRKSQVLNDGTVQVEMKRDNSNSTYCYRVPHQKADAFISESQKFDNKANKIRVGAVILGILGGTFGSHFCTKKMDSNIFKFLINSAAGISGAMLMDSLSGEYLSSEQNKIKSRYNAH